MKKLLLIVLIAIAFLALAPKTADAGWHMGFGIWFDDCDCYFGDPGPWASWWECPCYWDVWEWCEWHPYWMWPRWCREYVEWHYSRWGRYYYVYYDYYVPHCTRVFVDGRYRYRYAVEMGGSRSRSEMIPHRTSVYRSASYGRPMPETVSRTLSDLGPEYRIKDVAAHASPSLRSSSESSIEPTNRSMLSESILPIDSRSRTTGITPVEGDIVEKTSGVTTIVRTKNIEKETANSNIETKKSTRIETSVRSTKSESNRKTSEIFEKSKSSSARKITDRTIPSRSSASSRSTSSRSSTSSRRK
ncbi:hypothetical protein J7L01_08110 [bacterium]|nr:hypothetical protein [bacterium]